nr:tail fiber protein [uncultured Allomuricauda sp.]
MKTGLAFFLFMCFGSAQAQTEINKTVVVDAVGWKKVARLDGAYGRGYNEIVLMTRGGANAPRVAKISWLKGWSDYGGLNLVSISDNGYWADARITTDGVKAHLEVNFTAAIPSLYVYLNQAAWVGGDILDGTLIAGGGTVLVSAKFGRVNFGENDLFLGYNGKLGIGTAFPDSKLTVKGNIHAEEVKVDLSVPGPDYVFKEDYDLKSLEEVQNYIKKHGHLPNIPSAQEMEKNGVQLGRMNMKLLEKIEELTLYVIELKKENETQQKQIEQLKLM